MSSRIFISYTSRDIGADDSALIHVKAIFSSFANVFVDRLSPEVSWHPQLVIAWQVIRAHLLVLIESQSVYRSPWVLFELALAKLTFTPIVKLPSPILEKVHNKSLHRSGESALGPFAAR